MREKRQEEAIQAYIDSDGKTIINACPRFGKIKVAIEIMKRKQYIKPVILAPRTDILDGWLKDFSKFNFYPDYQFYTFKSIDKIIKEFPDIIIIDEPHEMSVNQQIKLSNKIKGLNLPILGLTGTMTNKTRNELYDNLNLNTCYKYSIADGVRDGILVDYQLFIYKVPLDNREYKYVTKSKKYTEQGFFNLQEYLKKQSKNPKTKYMLNLKMINILQNSTAKMEKTRKLISSYKDERVLVFCGVTEIADKLGIPVYHSKNREKDIFDDFCNGKGKHLATIKMMQAGITISPINKGIINYMSGNPEDSAQKICRFLGMEYMNSDKKAEIHIISSTEEFELERLKTGLMFFEDNKIIFY